MEGWLVHLTISAYTVGMEHATVGSRIRALRQAKGLSASALAHQAGVTENAIRKIESGDSHEPRFSTGVRIARALGANPDNLTGEPSAPSEERGPDLGTVIRQIRSRREELAELGITHVAIYGSIARGDGVATSDIDVVIEHANNSSFSLIDLSIAADILEQACKRRVDLLTKRTLERTAFSATAFRESVSAF